MSQKVLIVQPIAEEGIKMLEDAGLEPVTMTDTSKESLLKEVEDCAAILVRTAEIPKDVLKAGKNLKVIARHGVGVDNIPVETATELGIMVVNAPKSNIESVAEHIIGFMIIAAKQILKADKALRQGLFEVRNEYIGVELAGKTLGIVGLGRIGSVVAKKAIKAFTMKVLAYDPYLKPDQVSGEIELVTDWESFLSSCDFISVNCPFTEQTKGLIDADAFKAMKKSAYLINVARGGIVKESALIRALNQGEIAGAATDVYEEEPPDKDNPLFELDNVVLTPHMAAHTQESMIKMATHAAQGIIEVLKGKHPTYPVNPEVVE